MLASYNERLCAVQQRITAALAKSKNPHRPVRLICVSKGHDCEAILALYKLGYSEFGESYAQELTAKAEALKDYPIKWIFIGTLQSNKIGQIVRYAAEIQSVTSLKHLKHIAKYAKEFGKTPFPVYISVKTGSESTKSGISFKEALVLTETIKNHFPELKLCGLFTLPPPLENLECDAEGVPVLYYSLKDQALSIGEGRLSLGMSHDLEAAIFAGSDCLRIGTDIFGPRISDPK